MVARFHYDHDIYQQFLDNRLSSSKSNEVTRHVETCVDCQAKLEDLLQQDVGWNDLPTLLQTDDPTSPQGRCSWTGPKPTFLKASDHSDSLGRFGRYEITEILGFGGMGLVMKGFDSALGRFSAIKVLAPHLATNAAARRRFAREAKSAAAVVHDHVVPIHTVNEEDGLPYLVMPVIEGESLQQRVEEEGALSIVEVLRIGKQIASGLAAAHEQGLVHRDIKPANVLLEDGVERVLLTDFGLARAADDANMTQSGVLAGTPQYMSPEQAHGSDIDHRSDLFSLGSVLYFMCTAHAPFRAETTMGVLHRIGGDEPRSIRTVNEDVPRWFEAIVERLLEKDREHRFQSAEEVEQLLGRWLAYLQRPDAAPKPPTPAPRRLVRKRDVNKWLALGLAGVAALALGLLIVIEMKKGTVTIESVRDDVPVRILKHGKPYKQLTVDRGVTSTRIMAGEYTIDFEAKVDGVEMQGSEVVLRRGETALVRIVEKSTSVARADRDEAGLGAEPPAMSSSEQSASRPSVSSASRTRSTQSQRSVETDIADEIAKYQQLDGPVRVEFLEGTDQFIVRGRKEDVDKMMAIADSLAKVQERQFGKKRKSEARVFKAFSVNPAVLKEMLVAAKALFRGDDSVLVESDGERILVYATEAQHELMLDSLERFLPHKRSGQSAPKSAATDEPR